MFLKTVFWRSYTWSVSFTDIKVQSNIDITGVIKFYNDECSQIYWDLSYAHYHSDFNSAMYNNIYIC